MTEAIILGVFYAGFLASKEGWNGEYAGEGHEKSWEQLQEDMLLSVDRDLIPGVCELGRNLYQQMMDDGVI